MENADRAGYCHEGPTMTRSVKFRRASHLGGTVVTERDNNIIILVSGAHDKAFDDESESILCHANVLIAL